MQERAIAMARCFLRVINLTDDAFERLGRYEEALWRQVRQTLFSLEGLRRAAPPKHYRHSHYWWAPLADVASGGDTRRPWISSVQPARVTSLGGYLPRSHTFFDLVRST